MKTLTRFPSPRTMRQHPLRLFPAGLHAALLSAPLYAIFLALFLSGCIREELTTPAPGTGRTVIVNYSFDTPQTRAAATGAEREVKDVAIFFYNADDTNPNNETYVDCQSVSVPSSIGGSSGSFPLSLPPGILEGNKYKLILIGNYQKYAPEGKSLTEYAELHNTRTYSKMVQELQAQLDPEDARVTTRLPFWGRLLGKDGNETTLTGPSTTTTDLNLSVRFSRAVARFDLINLAAGQLKIAWVKVCNYRSRGYFYHEQLPAGDIVRGTATTVPTLPHSGYVVAGEPTGAPDGLRQDLTGGGMYAFPNTVPYTSQDDKLTTCLMIAGYYQTPGSAANTTKLTYYRANVGDNGNSQILRRNYIYTVVINSVKKEGADTEEGAINEKEKLLDYVVDNNWESDGGGTATDGEGNFLTLSRTSVVLGSEQDESVLVKVAVKKGTGWRLDWKRNEGEAFRYEKVNNESFNIITTGKNETIFTKNAELTVTVTGIASTVSITVNVTQLSSASDPRMLMVEGHVGNFDYVVPGQGGLMSLQVVTGGASSRWKAEPDNDLLRFVNSYTKEGSNRGFVDLAIAANTGEERRGTLTVRRILSDGSIDNTVDPVRVTFVQGTSPYKVTMLPSYVGGLEIDGFSPTTGNANKVSVRKQFHVLLADPANYTFEATCTFNQASDAFLTLNNEDPYTRTAGPLQTSKDNPTSVTGESGYSIWLNVFRTGPGDASIRGDIIVKAVPRPGTVGLSSFTVSQSVTIKSGCRIADATIGNLRWADRNVGALQRGDGGSLVGLNYSIDPKSDDYGNDAYQGAYVSFNEAANRCATFGADMVYEGELTTGWRVPSKDEQQVVAKRMIFSKQRAFILSDDKTAGYAGCWFPLSGAGPDVATNTNVGMYWSSYAYDYGTCVLMEILGNQAYASDRFPYQTMTVRCVRDITPAPAAR